MRAAYIGPGHARMCSSIFGLFRVRARVGTVSPPTLLGSMNIAHNHNYHHFLLKLTFFLLTSVANQEAPVML
jgi:hypothetical protein